MATDPNAKQSIFTGTNYMVKLNASQSNGWSALENLLAPTDQSMTQHKVDSLFNKFTIFQYSGLNAGSTYQTEGHFIGHTTHLKSSNEYQQDSAANEVLKAIRLEKAGVQADSAEEKARVKAALDKLQKDQGLNSQRAAAFRDATDPLLSNPTGRKLIDWGKDISPSTVTGYQPYSLSDFMFCKHYGKIPNNRLITLRRYPFPIGDTLRLRQDNLKSNAIPIAQAVTWFGSDTGNTLSSLGVFAWDMPWSPVEVKEQEITGNEITFSELVSVLEGALGGAAGKSAKATLEAAFATLQGSDAAIQQLSGYEAQIQTYQKNLYNETSGPYWNRIYGPVNVIHKSSRRERGVQNTNWNTSFMLNFSYSFRSFNGLSPKIAALDLISNFMNLTYNDAQFLGQLARYFPKLGLKFNPSSTEAIGKILTSWGTTYAGNNSEQFATLISNMLTGLEAAGSKIQNNLIETIGKGIQSTVMSPGVLGKAIPELISMKSALSDRPVGEWHMVVGNPINPIFVMGDLICTNVTMKWDDEIGPDDFPTGVSFAVTLQQGKPRDKTAIERMLNLGETRLGSNSLRTSSAEDTFGEKNNELWNKIATDSAAGGKATGLSESVDKIYESLKDPSRAGSRAAYDRFRTKFLTGYEQPDTPGQATNPNGKIDDSVLLFYYQRQYGKN